MRNQVERKKGGKKNSILDRAAADIALVRRAGKLSGAASLMIQPRIYARICVCTCKCVSGVVSARTCAPGVKIISHSHFSTEQPYDGAVIFD